MLSKIWVAFFALSLICGLLTGRIDQVSAAAANGAAEAVTLLISITGLMCLWSGVMELVTRSGLSKKIERCMRPVLRPLFGNAARNSQAMEAVSANVTANLLGLSNAATPIGLQAASALYDSAGRRGTPDVVLTLITLNTASIQIIPSTIAAVRAGYGCQTPFDIMPAIWCASILSVAVVLLTGHLLKPLFPDGRK